MPDANQVIVTKFSYDLLNVAMANPEDTEELALFQIEDNIIIRLGSIIIFNF